MPEKLQAEPRSTNHVNWIPLRISACGGPGTFNLEADPETAGWITDLIWPGSISRSPRMTERMKLWRRTSGRLCLVFRQKPDDRPKNGCVV